MVRFLHNSASCYILFPWSALEAEAPMLIVSNVLDWMEYTPDKQGRVPPSQFSESQIMLLRQPASPCTRGVESGNPLHSMYSMTDRTIYSSIGKGSKKQVDGSTIKTDLVTISPPKEGQLSFWCAEPQIQFSPRSSRPSIYN